MTGAVPRVPESRGTPSGELTASDAWAAVRRARWSFWSEAFARFRYGDGFSHSRALALQLSLAFIPLVIATVGLSGAVATDRVGQVLQRTLIALTPGGSDEVIRDALAEAGQGAQIALWSGLALALGTLSTAMGQVERGANRIYGIPRDRPTVGKYRRGLAMAFIAGLPAMTGFGLLLAGSAYGRAVEEVYGVDDDVVTAMAFPAGTVLLLASITAMLRWTPHRRQPGWSWLVLGAVTAFVLWTAFTGLLAAYVQLSGSFGAVYGPLTGVIALLLWAQLTSAAIFLGLAVTAQLEAEHVDSRADAVDPSESLPAGDTRGGASSTAVGRPV